MLFNIIFVCVWINITAWRLIYQCIKKTQYLSMYVYIKFHDGVAYEAETYTM